MFLGFTGREAQRPRKITVRRRGVKEDEAEEEEEEWIVARLNSGEAMSVTFLRKGARQGAGPGEAFAVDGEEDMLRGELGEGWR